MFLDKEKRHRKELQAKKREQDYARVYALHERAAFLCYINDAYMEEYDGKRSVKLEGLAAKGTGNLEDTFLLFDCEGNQKAEVTMEEFYLGTNSVERLEGGDKKIALYPKEQDVSYCAGDILCTLKKQEDS